MLTLWIALGVVFLYVAFLDFWWFRRLRRLAEQFRDHFETSNKNFVEVGRYAGAAKCVMHEHDDWLDALDDRVEALEGRLDRMADKCGIFADDTVKPAEKPAEPAAETPSTESLKLAE